MSGAPADNRSDQFALTVDLGSGALKLGLVSLAGEVVAVQELSLQTERLPGGGAVQDAAAWWEAVRALSGAVLADGRVERVVAVACTGQWASTVPVDADGEPVGPCLMWLDTRGAHHARGIVGGPLVGYSPTALLTWVRHTAGIPSVFGGDPVAHMLHLERDEPTTAAAARWYLEPVDYLSMRFTGRAAATLASMSAAWLTDNRRLDRLVYDPVLLRRTGVDADKLPPLVPTGSDRRDRPSRGGERARARVRRQGRHRSAGSAHRGARNRRDAARARAHDDQHHLVDLDAGHAQED